MQPAFTWSLDAYLMLAAALAVVVGALFAVVVLIKHKLADASSRVVDGPPLDLANALSSAANAAEAAIQRVDPSFTACRLEAHIRTLYQTLSERPHEEGRLWLSDGLYQRLETEARLTGASEVRELHASHDLAGVQLSGSDADAAYQSVRARLTFVPRAPNAGAGAGRTQEFRLLRRMGSKTPAVGLLEGKCPHCGAPLKVAATGRCTFCEAVINSGEHDWVLIAIADGSASMHRKADVDDLGALRAADPALSADEMEDRAALAFWRWHEARGSSDTSRLATSATESFCEQLKREGRAGPAPQLAGTAAFQLRALSRGDTNEQQAHVEARWVERDAQGADTHRRAVMRLRRHPDALTSRPQGLATARCTRCLGPLPDSAAACCSFCQATFDTVWRLDAILGWDAWYAWFTTNRARAPIWSEGGGVVSGRDSSPALRRIQTAGHVDRQHDLLKGYRVLVDRSRRTAVDDGERRTVSLCRRAEAPNARGPLLHQLLPMLLWICQRRRRRGERRMHLAVRAQALLRDVVSESLRGDHGDAAIPERAFGREHGHDFAIQDELVLTAACHFSTMRLPPNAAKSQRRVALQLFLRALFQLVRRGAQRVDSQTGRVLDRERERLNQSIRTNDLVAFGARRGRRNVVARRRVRRCLAERRLRWRDVWLLTGAGGEEKKTADERERSHRRNVAKLPSDYFLPVLLRAPRGPFLLLARSAAGVITMPVDCIMMS